MARISCVVPVVNNSVNVPSLSATTYLRVFQGLPSTWIGCTDVIWSSLHGEYTYATTWPRSVDDNSTRFEFSRIESIRVFISNLPVRVCTLSKDAFGSSELRFSRLFNVQKLWCLILYAKINQKDKKEWYSFRPIFQIRWNWSISNWI